MHLDTLKFDSSRAAALRQIDEIVPDEYAQTRNFLDGKVTHMSAWLTHGWTNTLEVAKQVNQNHQLSFDHKLVFELCWREFFKHVHGHLQDEIFENVKDPFYKGKYARQIPTDIIEGRTGVKPIDESVRLLYQTGYLHNHARMWLASYVVHIRKTDWRAGANWMYSHLLDGDLASNHLSWQWITGTFSNKPYLFNADNVKKFAPLWCCPNTKIDASYDTLNQIALQSEDLGAEANAPLKGMPPPEITGIPENLEIASLIDLRKGYSGQTAIIPRHRSSVRLIHPWNLGDIERYPHAMHIGILDNQFHEQFKWSKCRWKFVLRAITQCQLLVLADSRKADLFKTFLNELSTQILTTETLNPGYNKLLSLDCISTEEIETILPAMRDTFHPSFSKFYKNGVKALRSLESIT